MSSIKIITHVEDFTSSGFENIFYHVKSRPSTFIRGEDKVIDDAHMQNEKNMFYCFLVLYPKRIS